MADDAAMAAAAALIEDAIEAPEDPVEAVLGKAPIYAEDLYPRNEAAPEEETEQTAPEATPNDLDLSQFTSDTSGLDWLQDEPEPDDEEDYTVEPPSFDEPVAAPVTAEETWDEDEEKQALRRQVAQLQKRAQWEQEQRVAQSQKKWREEAARRFPLSDPGTINATSRRAMLRDAKAQHDRVSTKIRPLLDRLEQERTQVLTETRQEVRREAQQAWGKPAVNVGQAAVEAPQSPGQSKLRRGESFYDRVRSRLGAGDYGNI